MENRGVTPKIEIFWSRYVRLAMRAREHSPGIDEPVSLQVTLGALADLWACSPRAARETLARLQALGLLEWRPSAGRGHRSSLLVAVHPVWIYARRAQRAEAGQQWAEAAFWYQEILNDCPCVPDVPTRLAALRQQLGLPPMSDRPCCAS